MSNTSLFSEFSPADRAKWMDKIQADLKGADFDKKLVWKTIDGINIQPFYMHSDLENLALSHTNIAEFPYLRGHQSERNDWHIRQDFFVKNIDQTNTEILDALMRGVTSVRLVFKTLTLSSQKEFDRLLRGIDISAIELNFSCSEGNADLLSMLSNYIKANGIAPAKVKGSLNIDPISWTAQFGTCRHKNLNEAYQHLSQLIQFADEHLPHIKLLAVNSHLYSDAGSSIIQELSFAISITAAYFDALNEKLSPERIAHHLHFNIGLSNNYFMEIAKIRALRFLFAKIAEANGVEPSKSNTYIHAQNTIWNKTIFDPYVNMLRVTTEAMSGAIAGVDAMTILPFDEVFKSSENFSKRIARNTQILLKEEAHFDKVIDPAGGSYYIEAITDTLVEHAWQQFLKIDETGGFVKALEEGSIQAEVRKMAQERDINIALRKDILLGTNQYPNSTETMFEKTQIPVNVKLDNRLIQPYRGAEAFEAVRFATEQAEKTPTVFMLTYGNLAMRRARSQFAGNFFGCAGYTIIDNNGFASIKEGMELAKQQKADIIVLCSDDDTYIEMAKEAMASKPSSEIVIAGYPKEHIDTLNEMGIEHFIHVKSNVLEMLQMFNNKLLK
ncbi:MAG: methylmalonyl-CoA mutase small subunit [Bacteroidales bacterium]|nr:methylmalonyl-CoA mutase small subunit [Bacteroidales bacterium]